MQLRHLSDEDLVEEARAGSDAAFAALYVRYQRDVHARCFAVLRDHDEAADASQNAMINALRALRRNGTPANLRGWLLTIAHNEAVSLMRRSRPSEPLDHGHGGAGPGADEGAFARERLRQLVDDLNALPDRQRGALLLREASGYIGASPRRSERAPAMRARPCTRRGAPSTSAASVASTVGWDGRCPASRARGFCARSAWRSSRPIR